MTVFSVQAPRAVIMIRPHRFAPNPATARDNAFQATDPMRAAFVVSQAAYDECTDLAATLERAGVRVHLFDDIDDDSPDSVFPNNWFSTHSGGHVVTYPMASPSRRKERRSDILEMLKDQYRVQSIVDYSGLEQDGVFLEGTGAMVLDHAERVAYAVKSDRMSDVALERFCTHVGFEPVVFDAADSNGVAVYHTNVLMCIGDAFCLAAFDMITDPARRAEIHDRLTASGRVTINLSERQIREFAGNAIELMGTDGRVLALSRRAFKALTADQIRELERFVTLVPVDIPTIELAGGSVRCMIAGIHLSPRLETHANTATKKAS